MSNFSVIVLAAGSGTRMKSSSPKVMHKLSGKFLLMWTIDAVVSLNPDNIVVVLNREIKELREYLFKKNIKIIYQKRQLGSAHAVMQSKNFFKNYKGNILILSGDVPLIQTSTLLSLIKNAETTRASVTVLATRVENPFGYGRIIKKNDSILEKIVEENDATSAEKQIKEINSGIYFFDNNLWKILSKIKSNNVKREYYITDAVSVLRENGMNVSFLMLKNSYEVKGINNRTELSQVESILQHKKIKELLNNGVSIIDTSNVYISYDAKIGCDTVIYPGVFIDTCVLIGKNCIVRGATYISNSQIGNSSSILYSYIKDATIGKNVVIGPFSHIRQNTILKENVKIGNFSEIKKSLIAKNSKVSHLSYIGDAKIGKDVNIGAGTITCNYDGKKKHKTLIGAKSFVGSNVNFIAPIKIGQDVLIAAGSTITHNVPSHKIVIARAKQEIKNK
ncbi:MAG: bifunctional UDP-N-acetylglucosamine diphosphorylase/glucosamine-1-phosphate N-acetyltransferase GlmU [Endomicrobium sp.]|jgi:bifunctional UDP-N-acetylglucosamine pyrophosphorylase/glucosamine-1-phosphate N-acetyltransferase|nr:bifunctional UDP-N-acetylglucosamine diphosphorylase/glucosamine-1-phosphate N-acetyltransferase GlmU [Endomicrobium sp.]